MLRLAISADRRVEYDGSEFHIPYLGKDSTGLGKPLRTTIPLFLGPDPHRRHRAEERRVGGGGGRWCPPLPLEPLPVGSGVGRVPFRCPARLRRSPTVLVAIDDDIDRARAAVRPRLALHVGGMGARGKNFYHALVTRYGYASEADEIQDRFLSGDRDGANRAVSDAMVDDLALVGPTRHVAERLSAWRSSPVSTLIAEPHDQHSLEELARVW